MRFSFTYYDLTVGALSTFHHLISPKITLPSYVSIRISRVLDEFLSQIEIGCFGARSGMASPQEKEGEYLEDYEEAEAAVESSGCGVCFRGLCFTWGRSNNGGTYRYLLEQQQKQENRESWLKRRVKKVKEISEALEGPKWKAFIRRFSVDGMTFSKRRTQMQFQYDPESYKLNFDDREVECGGVDFSVRYAVALPVGLNKGKLAAG